MSLARRPLRWLLTGASLGAAVLACGATLAGLSLPPDATRPRPGLDPGGIDWTDPGRRGGLMRWDCIEIDKGRFDTHCFGWDVDGEGDWVVRTREEYDELLACDPPWPIVLPPVPEPGQTLLVSTRFWSGCGGCVSYRCVFVPERGQLAAAIDASRGWGDCDALGLEGGWALVEVDGGSVTFRDVGDGCLDGDP